MGTGLDFLLLGAAAFAPSIAIGIKELLLNKLSKGLKPGEDVPIPLSDFKVIGKFMTCNDGFTDELKQSKKLIELYLLRKETERPANILLAASPGIGKSFLAKQLSSAMPTEIEVEFEEYQAGAMRS
jgi:SpoVK/Ycf46/Vps4 family AAA+-type ATPase